jgi:hypothetical protein
LTYSALQGGIDISRGLLTNPITTPKPYKILHFSKSLPPTELLLAAQIPPQQLPCCPSNMTTPIADISKQILAMQDDLASALEAERVAKADLDEASYNFATQKKDVWEATGHYIRAQKRKLALSVTLRERQVETTRVAERTEEVLRENGDLQRKLEGLGGEEEVDASLFVRHLLGLRRVLKVRVILLWDKPEGKSPPFRV